MIAEGSDGLSRGLWISPCQHGTMSSVYLSGIFRSAPHDPVIIEWLVKVSGAHKTPKWVNHLRPLHHKLILGNSTLFTPPPHVARQVINAVLGYWVEDPRHTSAFFLIPGILQNEWGRVNKHMSNLGIFQPESLPFNLTLHSTIPLTLLSLPCFIPTVTHRLDSSPRPSYDNWHVKQADQVRGLLETNF